MAKKSKPLFKSPTLKVDREIQAERAGDAAKANKGFIKQLNAKKDQRQSKTLQKAKEARHQPYKGEQVVEPMKPVKVDFEVGEHNEKTPQGGFSNSLNYNAWKNKLK